MIAYATAITLICLLLHEISGQCNFPNLWTTKSWLHEYNENNTQVAWINNYTVSGGQSKIQLYTVDTSTSINRRVSPITINFDCTAGIDAGQKFYYVKHDSRDYYCVEAESMGMAILTKTSNALRVRPRVEDCPSIIPRNTNTEFEVEFPLPDTGLLPPIPAGEYFATYSQAPNQQKCVGYFNSTVTVTSDSLVISTCRTGPIAYPYPFRTQLKIVGVLPGATIDGSNDNGDVMLLAFEQDPNTPRYYCARYRILPEPNGNAPAVYISLDITSAVSQPKCRYGASYLSLEQGKFVTLTMQPAGRCAYSGSWVSSSWWSSYTSSIGMAYVDFNQYGTQITDTSTGMIDATWCMDESKSLNGRMVTLTNRNGVPRLCVEYLPVNNPNVILVRESVSDAVTASECEAELKESDTVQALVKSTTLSNPATMRCPFNEGQYQVTYRTNGQNICSGDTTSIVIISNNAIRIQSCTNTNTYALPVQSELKCISYWEPSALESTVDIQSGANYLLLSYQDPLSGKTLFYCGRYIEESGDPATIKLSIATSDSSSVACNMRSQEDTAGNILGSSYVAFTLSRFQQPTTPSPPPDPPQQPECGCLRGQCVYINGAATRCSCPPDYTGTKCEVALPSGSCANQPCATGRYESCTDSTPVAGYYYCKCLPGYEGPRCQTNSNNCASSVCKNGATCEDKVNDYTCSCREGFNGEFCENVIAGAARLESDDLTIIIGLVVGLGLLLILVVIVALLICHYRNKEREKNVPKHTDDVGYEGSTVQAWYPDYKSDVTR